MFISIITITELYCDNQI